MYKKYPHLTRRAIDVVDLKRMNLPEEYWGSRLNHVEPSVRPIVDKMLSRINIAVEKGLGFYITGGPGAGKTSIAVLLGKEAKAWGHTVYFTTFSALRDALRDEVAFDESESVFSRVYTVDVLILDNLRAEDLDEKYYLSLRAIEELVESRRASRRVTILTIRSEDASVLRAIYAKKRTSRLLEVARSWNEIVITGDRNFWAEKGEEEKRAFLSDYDPNLTVKN